MNMQRASPTAHALLDGLITDVDYKNHYKSGHVESFSYASGEMIGVVHASRRQRLYKVSVSIMTLLALVRLLLVL